MIAAIKEQALIPDLTVTPTVKSNTLTHRLEKYADRRMLDCGDTVVNSWLALPKRLELCWLVGQGKSGIDKIGLAVCHLLLSSTFKKNTRFNANQPFSKLSSIWLRSRKLSRKMCLSVLKVFFSWKPQHIVLISSNSVKVTASFDMQAKGKEKTLLSKETDLHHWAF